MRWVIASIIEVVSRGYTMGRGFDEREKSMEAKWAHDEDLRFRAITRRNKLLAEWAAETAGLKDADAVAYLANLLELEVRGATDEHLVKKIHDDLSSKSFAYSLHFIRRKMDELALVATNQVMNEPKA
jgi:hypothetical protein